MSRSLVNKLETGRLLPPLVLYRRILRANRMLLNPEMCFVGNEYVKKEFRDHRDVEDPEVITRFLREWQGYLQVLQSKTWHSYSLEQEEFSKMSDDQISKVNEIACALRPNRIKPSLDR